MVLVNTVLRISSREQFGHGLLDLHPVHDANIRHRDNRTIQLADEFRPRPSYVCSVLCFHRVFTFA